MWSQALLLALLCLGCASFETRFDYDPEAQLQGLETWAWASGEQHETGDPRVDNALFDGRVRRAVTAQLAAQGYRREEQGPVDFRVGYLALVDHRREVEISREVYDDSFGFPDYSWWDSEYVDAWVYEYNVGSLIVDVLHPSVDRIMWRGVVEAELLEDATPEQRSARIEAAVARILTKFPPD